MDQEHTNYKDLDENLAWLTQKTEEPKCYRGNFTFPQHTQQMQLNCKVIKKWQPPAPISTSTFLWLSPLSSKIFGTPPSDSIFPTMLGHALFLLYSNDLPDDFICNIAIYADDTTLYSNCDQASDLWQQLELASEHESDLPDTVDWDKKWLVDFSAGKTQLVSFDCSVATT